MEPTKIQRVKNGQIVDVPMSVFIREVRNEYMTDVYNEIADIRNMADKMLKHHFGEESAKPERGSLKKTMLDIALACNGKFTQAELCKKTQEALKDSGYAEGSYGSVASIMMLELQETGQVKKLEDGKYYTIVDPDEAGPEA